MTKNLIKGIVKVGAIVGGACVVAEFFGSFGQGLMLGQLMRMDDPYAMELNKALLEADITNKRIKRWVITNVASWNSKRDEG